MSSAATSPFPPGCAARLHIAPEAAPHQYLVCVAMAYAEAVPDTALRPGNLSVLVTHDGGVDWPDRRGELLARAILAGEGVVILGFCSLADALGCHRRLRAPA